MITIFADDSKDRKGLGDIAIAISEILHIEDMDISIDVCHIDSGWHGYCDVDGDYPSNADVNINEDLSFDDKVVALAHELIHVCQFANQIPLEEDDAYEYENILANMARALV